jgi:16S rRNA (guanine966-N2)-methyltransferase
MRIIAGDFKGRRLKAPTWDGLRPTSDKLRETLFNPGARVLDIFAGTGAIGLESLSRGAAAAVFIESDRRASDLIVGNAELCGARDRCVIIRDTAEQALQHQLSGDRFDLIVLDPPYDFEPVALVLSAAAAHLAPAGWIVLEHARRRAVPDATGLRAMRTVLSGDSALTFFEAP